MGLPSINIVFKAAAESATARIRKGVVAVIVRDAKANGNYTLSAESAIPADLGADNKAYIQRAFVGYETRPQKVLLCVTAVEAANFDEALAWLANQSFDYLAGPPDITQDEAKTIGDWVKQVRQEQHSIAKAVLPNYAGESEALVNFSAADIQVGEKTYTAGAYCSRIAGILAGTPMTMSCTYAPLPEVTDIDRLSGAEGNAAVDAGKLILIHDGEKVKVGLGVTSLTKPGPGQNKNLKKIKIVEVLDLIQVNLRRACQDSWIGRHSASYDDKCLLLTAVRDFLTSLENEGILRPGSTVGMDVDAIRSYLEENGTDTSKMDEQTLKEADTGNSVFILCGVGVLDAIENITIQVNY